MEDIINETIDFKKELEAFDSKRDRRAFLLRKRKDGYDFHTVISLLLFGPQSVRNKSLGFYVLKTVANNDLMHLELAWCFINAYGNKGNRDDGIKRLLKLEDKIRLNPPTDLFRTAITGMSWKGSNLMRVLERSKIEKIRQEKISRLRAEKRQKIECIKKAEQRQKLEEERKIIIWRRTHASVCVLIEIILPIIYYFAITSVLDIFAYKSMRDSDSIQPVLFGSFILFQICLIVAYMVGKSPTPKDVRFNFPQGVIPLPFVNSLYLFGHYSGWIILWILGYIIVAVIILKIGWHNRKSNISQRDFDFFKRVIYPIIPPSYNWPMTWYLLRDYGDLRQHFPHLPERFSKYKLVHNSEDGLWSTPGTFFNGSRI